MGRMGVYRRFESNEKHARPRIGAGGFVRSLGRPIRIGSRLEHGRAIATICNVQFSRHKDHSLGGSVPMRRDGVVRGYLEEDVRIRFGRVSVKDGDLAPLGKEWWTWVPFELRIVKSKCERLLGW